MREKKKLRNILDAIEAIEAYSVSNYDEFLADTKTQDAIFYNLIIIGEAANRISDEFQEQHYNIPWSSMIGTRNIIVHGYDQVKLQIVWEILQRRLRHKYHPLRLSRIQRAVRWNHNGDFLYQPKKSRQLL